MDALRPGGALTAQVVVQLQQRPALQDPGGRDPALRQPALSQQQPQVPRVGLTGLGAPLAAAGERSIGRLGQMRRDPAAASSSATYRQPAHPSTANATSSRPEFLAFTYAERHRDLA
ncbi:MAG TPA: hypothetical protein VNO25_13845 [Streptosporangiaceae bacterium]|nr:hypothetical protein [Streptosporangiaceae bacterium]